MSGSPNASLSRISTGAVLWLIPPSTMVIYQLQLRSARNSVSNISKRVPKIPDADQTADHYNKADDRSEGRRSAAPPGIYSGLNDAKIQEPGDDREDLERARLPIDSISR